MESPYSHRSGRNAMVLSGSHSSMGVPKSRDEPAMAWSKRNAGTRMHSWGRHDASMEPPWRAQCAIVRPWRLHGATVVGSRRHGVAMAAPFRRHGKLEAP